MSACEECWSAAYIKSRMTGRSQVDCYAEELFDHPEHAKPSEESL